MITETLDFPVEDYTGETRMESIELCIFRTGTMVSLALFRPDVEDLKAMHILVEVERGQL